MNADELHRRRNAIRAGLESFLSQDDLVRALNYWETHYASHSRYTLQHFVSDLCSNLNSGLRERRSEILLSLVKSMQASPPATKSSDADHQICSAFTALMEALIAHLPLQIQQSLRLDLMASLSVRTMPPELVTALRDWLGSDRALKMPSTPAPILRSLVNRAYVLLCERLGPVATDEVLAATVLHVKSLHPDLDKAIGKLL